MSNETPYNISSFVDDLIPEHIVNNYPELILFLKAYSDYLQEVNGAGYYLNNIDWQRDIDLIEDELLINLQNELGISIPKFYKDQIEDSKLFYKHLIEFYQSRGTAESVKAFFKIIYEDDVDIYYPKTDMLAPSDSGWMDRSEDIIANSELYTPSNTWTQPSTGNIVWIMGPEGYIHQNDTTPMVPFVISPEESAGMPDPVWDDDNGYTTSHDNLYFVDGVYVNSKEKIVHVPEQSDFYSIAGFAMDAYNYIEPSMSGEGSNADPAYIALLLEIDQYQTAFADTDMDDDIDNNDLILWWLAGIVDNQFDNPTNWPNTWQQAEAHLTANWSATQIAKAYEVWYATKDYFTNHPDRSNKAHNIVTVELYPDSLLFLLSNDPGGHVITSYPRGEFATHDGMTNVKKYIQDSFYYQLYSYVLRAGKDIELWGDSYSKLVHPAGFKFFGEIYIFLKGLSAGAPTDQIGMVAGGLPFEIFIPNTFSPLSEYAFGFTANPTGELRLDKELGLESNPSNRLGPYDHFDNTKFSNWRAIRDYREITIEDVINKNMNIHIGAVVSTNCNLTEPIDEFIDINGIVDTDAINAYNAWKDTCTRVTN